MIRLSSPPTMPSTSPGVHVDESPIVTHATVEPADRAASAAATVRTLLSDCPSVTTIIRCAAPTVTGRPSSVSSACAALMAPAVLVPPPRKGIRIAAAPHSVAFW